MQGVTDAHKTGLPIVPSGRMDKQGNAWFEAWAQQLADADYVGVIFSARYKAKVEATVARDGWEHAALAREARAILEQKDDRQLKVYILEPHWQSFGDLCVNLIHKAPTWGDFGAWESFMKEKLPQLWDAKQLAHRKGKGKGKPQMSPEWELEQQTAWEKKKFHTIKKSSELAWVGVAKFLQDCCRKSDVLGQGVELDAEQTLLELKDGCADYIRGAAWADNRSRETIQQWDGGTLVFAYCWRSSRPCCGLDQPFFWLVQQSLRSTHQELHKFTHVYWRLLLAWVDESRHFKDHVRPCWTIDMDADKNMNGARMRGTRLHLDAIAWWKEACRLKSQFTLHNGMSCSVTRETALRFMHDYSFPEQCDKALIEIRHSGRHSGGINLLMMGTRGQASEGEYLYPPGTDGFRADSMHWVTTEAGALGYWHIVISECIDDVPHAGVCSWI